MKKIISVICICLLSLVVLASCSKKTEAVKNVEGMIDGLAEVVIGTDSEGILAEIESAYNALSDEEKADVDNYDKLSAAKEELSSVIAKNDLYNEMNSAISEITDALQADFSNKNTDYAELISQVQDILGKYDELSDDEKENINITDEFNEAVDTVNALVSSAEKSAAEYVRAFNTVYADKKYEITGVYCIKQIREGTEYHTFALTYKDGSGEEHNIYANGRCSANTPAQTLVANADTFFSERAVSDDYNAIINSNIDIDFDAVTALAK